MGKYGDIILDKMSFGWTGYMLTTMLDSALMRSMAVGDLAAWPWEDLYSTSDCLNGRAEKGEC